MAKRAKTAKRAAKKGAAKSKKAKRAVTARKITAAVSMETVVQFVRMLINEGRIDEFESGARRSKARVRVDADGVQFVQKFLTRNDHLRPAMAAAIRDPCPGDNPFKC